MQMFKTAVHVSDGQNQARTLNVFGYIRYLYQLYLPWPNVSSWGH